MELDVLKVLLGHAEDVARVGQEDIASLAVERHVLVLALLEVLQFGLIAGHHLYPACLVEGNGFPAALGIVLILKTILDNLELKLTYSADNLSSIKLVYEQLCHAFVHQLLKTFLELL